MSPQSAQKVDLEMLFENNFYWYYKGLFQGVDLHQKFSGLLKLLFRKLLVLRVQTFLATFHNSFGKLINFQLRSTKIKYYLPFKIYYDLIHFRGFIQEIFNFE